MFCTDRPERKADQPLYVKAPAQRLIRLSLTERPDAEDEDEFENEDD
jgi:hypothetical protein